MNRLFWIDMEMTGLDVEKEVVIEVAAIVTDLNFQEIENFEAVVKQDSKFLLAMDAWNKEHHTKSGLIQKVPSGMEPSAVEHHLIRMIERNFPDHNEPKNRPILAGNSIAQDRLFIDKYFKNLSKKLHYRMLDVSSWKIVFYNKFGYEYRKSNNHRALDDIRESIQELQTYCRFVSAPNLKGLPQN